MKQILLKTQCQRMLADLYTPVGIYLRIRDQYPRSVLLESADNHAAENSFSFIGIQPIAGIEINRDQMEYKLPNQEPVRQKLDAGQNVKQLIWDFARQFKTEGDIDKNIPQGLMGYVSYEGIHMLKGDGKASKKSNIPEVRYRLYQYIIAINHFKNELFICESLPEGEESKLKEIEKLIRIKDCPQYPFATTSEEGSNMTGEDYKNIVAKAVEQCKNGELEQIVLSRSFHQSFRGDEFNVYRSLRSINPSPYLFYFDYGNYKLMGSSPESQLIIKNGTSYIHPIAGTVKRTGNSQADAKATEALLADPKENDEHDMLVELAKDEMKSFAKDVIVSEYKQVKTYSHVIHLVSEVQGTVPKNTNPLDALSISLPAGTLSGSPKEKALEIIDQVEPTPRGFYAGCIGFLGFKGGLNQAIMIRSFISRDNQLRYQAGAGIIDQSVPEKELQEVNNKMGALRSAIDQAEKLFAN